MSEIGRQPAMRTMILAGGTGTRLREQTRRRPKPLVKIGGHPILWHIMSHFAQYGLCDFFVALGYRGDQIKRYFLNRYDQQGDLTIDFAHRQVIRHATNHDRWRLDLIDTGRRTPTGGRLDRLRPYLSTQTFIVTYADGVSDLDLSALVAFHRAHGKLATVTAVRPPARFGKLTLSGDLVSLFAEKPAAGDEWINGGYLVFEPGVFDLLGPEPCSLEVDLLTRLAQLGQLAAYRHTGFWQCMDTPSDLRLLRKMWRTGRAPWKTWSDSIESTTQVHPNDPAAGQRAA